MQKSSPTLTKPSTDRQQLGGNRLVVATRTTNSLRAGARQNRAERDGKGLCNFVGGSAASEGDEGGSMIVIHWHELMSCGFAPPSIYALRPDPKGVGALVVFLRASTLKEWRQERSTDSSESSTRADEIHSGLRARERRHQGRPCARRGKPQKAGSRQRVTIT